MQSTYGRYWAKWSLGVFLLINAFGCKKLVDVNAPVTSVNSANVYASDATAISVLTGLYTTISTNGNYFTGNDGISLYLGLSADEFTLYNGVATTDVKHYYYTNTLISNANMDQGSDFWRPIYNYIYVCNAAIQGLNGSSSLTSSVKQQLLGEATFMRAFFYFYLVNLFGDVPLALTTDYKTNASLARIPQGQVYQQIITDLKNAQEWLSSNYLDGNLQSYTSSPQRVRPTKWAAAALLARTYLYVQDWTNAENESDSVINNSALFNLCPLNNVFLANSNEAIWQLQPINSQENTADGWEFILPSTGPDNTSPHPVYLSPQLLNSFEPGDQRRVGGNWVDSVIVNSSTFYYPFKYKSASLNAPLTESQMVLRLGEQYLVRAEAEAEGAGGGLITAINDLNMIRSRAGLANLSSALNQTQVLDTILHERQVELFTELGHRWLDLKRRGNIDGVMTKVCPQKDNSSWNSYQQLYPILFSDIKSDPNLTQNIGY